jgi:hypothetical protein
MRKLNDDDRRTITSLLKKGKTSEEIQAKLGKYTKMQIAAVKAWMTMRKKGWSGKVRGKIARGQLVAVFFKATDPRLPALLK